MDSIKKIDNTNIKDINIVGELQSSFLNYAMSIIVSRALPNARDGLKPVHRRILYSMWNLGMTNDKPYKKSARIVGDVIGKYHPHGDVAVYDTLVRMAQDFNYRYPLIQGHGNFGSIDGDSAAAMRYTEARMAKISNLILEDIDKETVDFQENYDGTEQEPCVLPSKIPNLLLNGSVGIAVGMATSIPPHNLHDVYDGLLTILKNPEVTNEQLVEVVKGPDFPTGGIIKGKKGIYDAYTKGHGSVVIESKYHFEDHKLVVTEIPFQVNKSKLVIALADLIKDEEKQLHDVTDLRDESNREGIRIVIEMKKHTDPYEMDRIKENLFKNSSLRTRFSCHLLALSYGVPSTLTLKDILQQFIDHRITIITNRSKYDLKKQQERLEILNGLYIAIQNIDEIIEIIKKSQTANDAKATLSSKFKLTDNQCVAILEMRLQRLTGLEKNKMEVEINEIKVKISELEKILNDKSVLKHVIESEFNDIKTTFKNERRTLIDEHELANLDEIDLIRKENVVVVLTKQNYIKKVKLEEFRLQNRGGVGVRSIKKTDEDETQQTVKSFIVTSTHDKLLYISNFGKIYQSQVYNIPTFSRTAKGLFVNNLIESLDKKNNENVQMIFSIKDAQEDDYLVFITKKGLVKKTAISHYIRINANGKKAIKLRDGDSVIKVLKVKNDEKLIIASNTGRIVRLELSKFRPLGRVASGVRGMKLDANEAITTVDANKSKNLIFSISSAGYGKINNEDSIRVTNRGAKGVRIFKLDKGEELISSFYVNESDEIIVTNSKGISIRTTLEQVRLVKARATKGVKVMDLENNEKVLTAEVFEHFEEQITSEIPLNANSQPESFTEEIDFNSDIKND